jgi:hypothetical protein
MREPDPLTAPAPEGEGLKLEPIAAGEAEDRYIMLKGVSRCRFAGIYISSSLSSLRTEGLVAEIFKSRSSLVSVRLSSMWYFPTALPSLLK